MAARRRHARAAPGCCWLRASGRLARRWRGMLLVLACSSHGVPLSYPSGTLLVPFSSAKSDAFAFLLRLYFDNVARFRFDDLDLGMARADLLGEPGARFLLSVTKEYGPRFDFANEVQQVVAVGVGSEIEVL